MGGGRDGEGLGPELIPKLFPIPFELIPKPYLGCVVGLGLGGREEGGEGEGFGLELIPKLCPIPFELIPKALLGCRAKPTPSQEWCCGRGKGGRRLGT